MSSSNGDDSSPPSDASERSAGDASIHLASSLRPVFSTATLIDLDTPADVLEKSENVRRAIEKKILNNFSLQTQAKTSFHLEDIFDFVQEGIDSVVQDDFTECFSSKPPHAWNWNAVLFPLWAIGWVIRHFIIFPLRVFFIFFCSVLIISLLLFYSHVLRKRDDPFLFKCMKVYGKCWLLSLGMIVHARGQEPPRRANQIYVSNHTTPLDFGVLLGQVGCATVGQRHGGFVGFFQHNVLFPLHNIWFERFEASDRNKVASRMQRHAADKHLPPLLLFPEGVCVNNEYVVMFRKGAFELSCELVPVAIKYDKSWCDPYWNSKEESFPRHLYRLMTAWCLPVDLTFLEPTRAGPNELPAQFAERVKTAIAREAHLTNVRWDGYYKYYSPNPKFLEERQKAFADVLLRRLTPVSSVENVTRIRKLSQPQQPPQGLILLSKPKQVPNAETEATEKSVVNSETGAQPGANVPDPSIRQRKASGQGRVR